jgi:TRAP-type C4-dicarboxylate transport system permease small subunit
MSGLVDKITKAVMGISAIVVFVITFLQVLCRFVLKSPLPWSTDILRLAFTYLVFWGCVVCAGKGTPERGCSADVVSS